jgi:hypothetical protein
MGAREAPEGAECYKSWGTHEVNPAKRSRPRGRSLPPDDHSIAPTEFPKVRSAVGQSGRETTIPHRIGTSGGGLQSPSQHPKADTGESLPPKGLVEG